MTIYSATTICLSGRLSAVIWLGGHVYSRATLHSSCREKHIVTDWPPWCWRGCSIFFSQSHFVPLMCRRVARKRQSAIHQPSIVWIVRWSGGRGDMQMTSDVLWLSLLCRRKRTDVCLSLVPRYLRAILSFDWTADEGGEPTKDHQPSERGPQAVPPAPIV
jgi:hypothetical protein